ncbi:MAG: universal stress protein [Actinomycetota bacterium]|nr:universal stress protein [Actinomycetota bacterium]
MTFHTIIVGVDGRQGGRDALALAQRLRPVAGELVAVGAHAFESYASGPAEAEYEAEVGREAHRALAAELERAGVVADARTVLDGSPARALHRAAEDQRAALIVVGSSHRGPVGRVVAGDTALSTLHGSPCPVVVAPARYAERPGPLASVGVGFDGSSASRAAVVLARDIAVALEARLTVLTVLEPSGAWTAYPSWAHDPAADGRGGRAVARASLDALVAALGANVSAELLEGEAARALARAGSELDLLVCGSRSDGPLTRLLLGSTSEALVREAPCR